MAKFSPSTILLCVGLAITTSSGCYFAPRSKLVAAEAQCRCLAEQNSSQITQMENLKTHSHQLEDKLMQTEEQLAALDQRSTSDRKHLAALEGELYDGHGHKLPPGLSTQLANLSRRYPNLQFDMNTGAAKLDSDVLFDSGDATLKEDAQEMLGAFGKVMASPEARDLKLMVVGHTDSLKIARKDVKDRFHDNFQLASARALAVADCLKKSGVPEQRIGVSGFGGHQPIASNDTAEDRHRNRRVEIFVLPPEEAVVGWTETAPSLY